MLISTRQNLSSDQAAGAELAASGDAGEYLTVHLNSNAVLKYEATVTSDRFNVDQPVSVIKTGSFLLDRLSASSTSDLKL